MTLEDMTPEGFAAWADVLGLTASQDHLTILRPEVLAMLSRIAPLYDIDVSAIPVEDAIGGSE